MRRRPIEASGAEATQTCGGARSELLEEMGIPDPAQRIDDYPHQFSGGMRQRIMIAMVLLLEPAILIADEATSALDVTLEAQILELFKRLRRERNTAIIFISHDLGVVSQICDRVVVMYAGRAVEEGDVVSLFERPLHPYTQALLGAIPSRKHRGERLATIPGRVPSLSDLPPGCKFADRCPHVQPVNREREPRYVAFDGRRVRCNIYDPDSGYEHASVRMTEARVVTAVAPRRDCATCTRTSTVSRAVDGIDLAIAKGEILGLVGESGSGKTTLGRTILRLVPSTSGRIEFDGQDVTRLGGGDLRRLRRRMQMIFQDPYSSLSPRLRVSYLLTEPYRIHKIPSADQISVRELLEMVELSPELAGKYPHELSGGQARRVGVARALALQPEFLIADEPTAGLDVSAAAAVLNLMKDLARRLDLTYLIITHNLNVVGYIADRIAVMYLGQLAETGPAERVLDDPTHPYTRALLEAVSEPDPRNRGVDRRLLLPGEIPSPRNPPPGCRFHTRCRFAQPRCREEVPVLEETEADHRVACHFWPEVRADARASMAAGAVGPP